jgi:hypothetical protein
MWQDVFDKHFAEKASLKQSSCCAHDDQIEENDQQICADCGEILNQRFVAAAAVAAVNGVARKRAPVSSIYAFIPSNFVSDRVKNLAVNIYKVVSVNRRYRMALRKTIVAACVYRASIVCDDPVSIFACAKALDVKSQSEIDKAMAFVTENLPYGDYVIPICANVTQEDDLQPILDEFGVPDEPISHLKRKLKTEAFFNQRSSVCACVWLYVVTFRKDANISLREFTSRYNSLCSRTGIGLKRTTACTIRKRYLDAKRHIFRQTLKRVFANYLYDKLASDEFESDEGDVIVRSANDADVMTIVGSDGFQYPIDDVDDITDWNILFCKRWGSRRVNVPYRVVDNGKKITLEGKDAERVMTNEIKRFVEV